MWSLAALSVLGGVAAGDILLLHDGREIDCQVISESTEEVLVHIGTIPFSFPREDVAGITLSGAKPSAPVSLQARKSLTEQLAPHEEFRGKCLRTLAANEVVVESQGRVETVRLLGVRPFAPDQQLQLQVSQLVTGRAVVVVVDEQVRDSSGTLQGYVFINTGPEYGELVNEQILKQGLADFIPEEFRLKYGLQLEAAAQHARSRRRGRWAVLTPMQLTAPDDSLVESELLPDTTISVSSEVSMRAWEPEHAREPSEQAPPPGGQQP